MQFANSWLITCVFALLYGVVFAYTHVEHEKRSLIEEALVDKRERVQGHVELPVRIGLTQRNLALGHEELMAISDPESPRFGQHYTGEEVEEFFAPSKDTVTAVRSWIEKSIRSHRISISSNKQWIQFDATASELESLVRTKYYYYKGGSFGSGIGCDRYHVPHEIREHIDYITPGVKLIGFETSPSLRRRNLAPSVEHLRPHSEPLSRYERRLVKNRPKNDCQKLASPDCIKNLYNINDNPPKAPNNSIGTFNQHGSYTPEDLAKFLRNYTNIDPEERPTFHGIDGAILQKTKFNDEANLDLQAVYSLAFPYAQIVYYQVDDPVYEKLDSFAPPKSRIGLNTFLDAIDGSYCSYKAFGIKGDTPGVDPTYPDPHNKTNAYKGELFFPMNYQRRQCNEFMKLGMQGTSLIFGSGDRGVEAQLNPGTNRSPFGETCLGGKKPRRFGPNYPSNCPYVTSVGGTGLNDMGEVAASDHFFSGGGFSNIYPRPKYQDKAVSTFLAKHTPPYPSYNVTFKPKGEGKGRYNAAGRAYPDVAAIGEHFSSVSRGKTEAVNGTSISAPVFAGIIARINAYRLASGKGALGFLNPALYKHPEMFSDIIKGDNPGCGTKGFSSAPGWDPVTGLGTPNYPKMKKILAGLP